MSEEETIKEQLKFADKRLHRPNFYRAEFFSPDFYMARIHYGYFRNALMCQTDFRMSDLRKSDFAWAHMDGCDFHETNLSKAILPKTKDRLPEGWYEALKAHGLVP